MILGIGIDAIEIERFAHWHTFSHHQLQRIFSTQEILYCLEISQKSAERFAVRFAAREALWKGLCQAWPDHTMQFFSFCRFVQIQHGVRGVPYFILDESYFNAHNTNWITPKILLSMSHSNNMAIALTIISKA